MGRGLEPTEEALFSLVDAGLAERSSLAGSDIISYRVHDLAHSYARAINNHRLQTVMRAAKRYLETHAAEPEVLEAELPNILGAVEHADAQMLLDFMRLLTIDGTYYLARGHSPRSMALLRKAISAAKQTNQFETAHYLLGKLGDSYQNLLGDLDKALAAYEEAAALAQQIRQHGREAVYLSACGIIRLKQENDAETYLESAYRLAKESGDDLSFCTVLEQRGFVEGMRQNHEKARD